MILEKIPVRIRLSLVHGLLMGIIFSGLGIGLYRIVQENLYRSLDAALLTSAKSIRDSQISARHKLSLRHLPYWESILNEFFGGPTNIRAYAQMVDTSGAVTAKTANIIVQLPVTPRAFRRAEKGVETYEVFSRKDEPELRQVTVPVLRRGVFVGELIQVAASMESTYRTLSGVRRMLVITLCLGLFFSVAFGYILTWWSFKPVVRITQEATTLGVSDLDKRLKLPLAHDELRTLIQTFNEMLDRLEDAFNRLRKFAGNVSHELRTPLAVMKGEADLALRRDRPKEQYVRAMSVIKQESENMSGIVEDLLLLARAQGNSIGLTWENVSSSKFVGQVVQSVAALFKENNVSMDVQVADELNLRISPNYLALALKNILINACKHSAQNQKVEFSFSLKSSQAVFRIKDFGEGIIPEDLPYIFDTFYRADSSRNRDRGGAGIGLSLAHALVKLHKGDLLVQSQIGKGSEFSVIIPLSVN